tara:strand:- start:57 stop:338 length:282 start_codon:yes stop_codon:yes gene_type:complete
MKVSKRQLQAIIKEEKSKLLSEQSDNIYLEALDNVATTADQAVESLELASRDIGPLDKELYEKIDEALIVMEDLMMLANQALERADMKQKGAY